MQMCKTCLNLSKNAYEKFKKRCKENFSSVSKEINLFMLREIKEEDKIKCSTKE